jgi:hypothetical protein
MEDLIAGLQKRKVQIELCGATARVHHWGNADLLPEISVNTDAMARLTQLAAQFVTFDLPAYTEQAIVGGNLRGRIFNVTSGYGEKGVAPYAG